MNLSDLADYIAAELRLAEIQDYPGALNGLQMENAKGEVTTNTYDAETGDLLARTGPVTGATTTFAYDGYGRLATVTDADGYAVTTSFDALNRVTARTYPDGTSETNTYARLDLIEQRDRLGRITRHFYDGFGRRRRRATQPAGRSRRCGATAARWTR